MAHAPALGKVISMIAEHKPRDRVKWKGERGKGGAIVSGYIMDTIEKGGVENIITGKALAVPSFSVQCLAHVGAYGGLTGLMAAQHKERGAGVLK